MSISAVQGFSQASRSGRGCALGSAAFAALLGACEAGGEQDARTEGEAEAEGEAESEAGSAGDVGESPRPGVEDGEECLPPAVEPGCRSGGPCTRGESVDCAAALLACASDWEAWEGDPPLEVTVEEARAQAASLCSRWCSEGSDPIPSGEERPCSNGCIDGAALVERGDGVWVSAFPCAVCDALGEPELSPPQDCGLGSWPTCGDGVCEADAVDCREDCDGTSDDTIIEGPPCDSHDDCAESQICLSLATGASADVCGLCGDASACVCASGDKERLPFCDADADCEAALACGPGCDDCPPCPPCIHGRCVYPTGSAPDCLCEGCA